MIGRARLNYTLIFAIGVSLFGSFTTVTLALREPANGADLFWRKPLIGSIFALICISGTVAAFFPRKCSETFYEQKAQKAGDLSAKNLGFLKGCNVLRGHHPSCGRFSAHILRIDGRILCAACTGLLFGGIAALAGTALYFFVGLDLGQFSLSAVWIGHVGVFLGFVQFKFSGYARFVVNASFVFATYLALAGTDALTSNISSDIYMVVLIIFWLWTRITISQWDHWKICYGCQHPCAAQGTYVSISPT